MAAIGALLAALLLEYPFDAGEVGWISVELVSDLTLPGRPDLLYLVLCTLVKNAPFALRKEPPERPQLHIALQRAPLMPGLAPQPVLRVVDNGPGIAPEVLKRLTREPVTTRTESHGSGLAYCSASA